MKKELSYILSYGCSSKSVCKIVEPFTWTQLEAREVGSQEMQPITFWVKQHWRRGGLYQQITKKSSDMISSYRREGCALSGRVPSCSTPIFPSTVFFPLSHRHRQSLPHFETEARSQSCSQTISCPYPANFPFWLLIHKFKQAGRGVVINPSHLGNSSSLSPIPYPEPSCPDSPPALLLIHFLATGEGIDPVFCQDPYSWSPTACPALFSSTLRSKLHYRSIPWQNNGQHNRNKLPSSPY